MATVGSTNHAIHLPAIARAAGIVIDWTDFAEISDVVPLLARVYPNGSGDVNNFHAAGGISYVIRELPGNGLLHGDIPTVARRGLADYGQEPVLENEALTWKEVPESRDESILRPVARPFSPDGGMKLLSGNLGRCVMKVSAVDRERWNIEATAAVFHDQRSEEHPSEIQSLMRNS